MVAVDGRQPGYSAGVTNLELAQAMMQLGVVSASALDAGGSTTMAFDGKLLNSPSDRGGERSVAEALLVSYTGVYVPPLAEAVLSPNGDRVADVESLSYKVVRPSTVQANLVGPDGATVPIDAGLRAPGTYKFSWAGPGPEGKWNFSVTATDDLTQTSAAERTFALNNTLAALSVRPKALKLRKKGTRLLASFKLARRGEGHRDRRDRRRHRRPHPLASLRGCRNAAGRRGTGAAAPAPRVRRVVQAARLGDEQARPRRPVRAVLGTPVVSPRVLLASLYELADDFVRDYGLYAVFVLMLVDAVLPAASELVMVVGGAIAAGAFNASISLFGAEIPLGFWSYVAVSLAGTLGYLVGAIIGWWIGLHGGRPLLERHGRWFHLTPQQLERAERWFDRYGDWAVLLGRVTPVIRSFVSIPGGVFHVPLGRYIVLTLVGSAIWCFAFAGAGWALGSSYESFHHGFDFLEIALVAGFLLVRAMWSCAANAPLDLIAVPEIPLVDVKAQYAPLIPELKRHSPRCSSRARSSSGRT